MKRFHPPGLVLLALGLALGLGSSAAREKEKEDEEQIHVCRDRSGQLVYQSYPCPEPQPAAAGERVADEPAAPPAPHPPQAKPRSKAKPQPKPKPAEKPKAPSAKPPTKAGTKPLVIARAPAPAVSKRWPAALPNVDPRFATPERTWSTFSAAVRASDRDGARACLTPTALPTLDPTIHPALPGALSGIVDEGARVDPQGEAGPYWCLRIKRRGERPKWVFLVRTERGEWKIAAL